MEKIHIIKEKCNEYSININNSLEKIYEKLDKHSSCLSNQYIYLNPYNGSYKSGVEHVISLGCKELNLNDFPRDWNRRGFQSLEQIKCLYQLEKIRLEGYFTNDISCKADIDEEIFRKIKNVYVKNFVICNCNEWKFINSIPIIITNMPNLERLELIQFRSIDKLADILSQTSNHLKEIKFTNCYQIDITKIKEYCIRYNIELIVS